MPTVQNWVGNIFGSGNRPYIEDIRAALELDPSGASISDHSWGQAGLPPGGGQWFLDWQTEHNLRLHPPSAGANQQLLAQIDSLQSQVEDLHQQQTAALQNAHDAEFAALEQSHQADMDALAAQIANLTAALAAPPAPVHWDFASNLANDSPGYSPSSSPALDPASTAAPIGGDNTALYIGLAAIAAVVVFRARR